MYTRHYILYIVRRTPPWAIFSRWTDDAQAPSDVSTGILHRNLSESHLFSHACACPTRIFRSEFRLTGVCYLKCHACGTTWNPKSYIPGTTISYEYLSEHDRTSILSFYNRYARRPRWLGKLSSCLLKSNSWVQFSPGAHTRKDFFLHIKMISGKRESVS